MTDVVLEQLRSGLEDRYRVDKQVGRGGMATVYLAQDVKHDRAVAIKVLSPDLAATIGAERFAREIRIAARLSHPHILTVFDSGQVGGLLYYVMPFVEGESLRDRLEKEKQLPIDDAIQITCEVADALSFAHSQGVVHRDIKPENILLQAGNVLVADFGIARGNEPTEGPRLTSTGISLGTAQYMSPEQSAGETVDARSDIYALACTLYEMLVGEPPFNGANAMMIMARHALEPPPSIRVVRSAVPEELENAVLNGMAKVPADRFQTMEEFKRAVLGEAAVGTNSNPRYTARYRTKQEQPKASRRPVMIGLGVGALVLVAGGLGAARLISNRSAGAATDANRVAVLYFDDQSNGPLRFVADGLTESLIDRLSSVAALDVVSRNGVRTYRGRTVSPDSVGRALHVGSIVRGSVEAAGDKVLVTVRLVDAPSGADIGHQAIPMDTAHIVAQQGEIANQVAAFLRKQLGNEIQLREDRAATTSPQAWTLLERAGKLRKDADSLSAAGKPDSALAALVRADSLLGVAESLDKRWSKVPAERASVAYARASLLNKTPTALPPVLDSGLAFADRALAAQPNDADAFEAKGKIQYVRYTSRVDADVAVNARYLTAAESTLIHAVEQNKNQAGAWAALSSLYYKKLDIQAANNAARKAYEADAYLSSARLILSRLFWTSHDLEAFPEALKWCDEGRRRFPADPQFTGCRLWMYTTRYQKPDVDSAWAYRARYIALTPESKREYATKEADVIVGGALARAGLADSARHVLLRARATPQLDPTRELQGYEAVMRVILGDQDEAVRLIQDYLTVNPTHREGFAKRTGWWWRDLQGNPKFKALIAGAR